MRMQNQLKANNKIKKSQLLFIGSFLIFIGLFSLSWDYLIRLKDEIYSDMKISMMDKEVKPSKISITNDTITDAPVAENVNASDNSNNYVIDYSKYLGVLEIPKIGLKRGFYDIGSRYNNIQYNVTMVEGSSLPTVQNGNLILMAHSGDAYISYFAYLYRLEIGDYAYITYAGQRFPYQIVNIYEVEKNGVVAIRRNAERTSLTLITCTKNNAYTQTVYVAELAI